MRWIRYTIETTTAAEDLISCALVDLGIEGVEIENHVPLTAEDQAKMFIDFLPEIPEDDGSSRVSFYLEPGDREEIPARVREAIEELRAFVDVGPGTITVSETEDADWMNNWKEFFHPFLIEYPEPDGEPGVPEASADGDVRCGILIKPTWEPLAEADEDKILIEIDPGISFGTGKHETTQLCIRQLMKHVRKGDEVLDLGCGSGILSIVSLKLGASHVVGTDIDEACIVSTMANFEVNGLEDGRGDFYVGNLIDDASLRELVGSERYDVVVANILADVIIPMAPLIPGCLKAGGVFIASGIIDSREDEVRAAIEAAGLEVLEITHQGEWVGITGRR